MYCKNPLIDRKVSDGFVFVCCSFFGLSLPVAGGTQGVARSLSVSWWWLWLWLLSGWMLLLLLQLLLLLSVEAPEPE